MGIGFLFFPELCPVCDRLLVGGERHICLECLADLPYSFYWSWRDNPAERMIREVLFVDCAASLLLYRSESKWKKPIHNFKYYGDRSMGKYLSALLGRKLYESGWSSLVDYIIPVPLHSLRRWQRGFNQAAVIALELGVFLKKPVLCNAMTRKRYTFTQTKKDREHRRRGVEGAFRVRGEYKNVLSGKRVLLVDDVLTTGATVEACGNELVKAGCSLLSVATLAFVE